MRKIATLIFVLLGIVAKSQIGFEDYYSEKDLLANLQRAKKPAQQLDASGILAVHYKRIMNDSTGTIYLNKLYQIAEAAKDAKLMARAIWWDINFDGDTVKANKLLQHAIRHNLTEEKIIAYLSLADYYIHHKLLLAERNALTANTLLVEWEKDSVQKDSVKLEVYRRLAHVYVHKKDGINASRYLLPLKDYARLDNNESLRIQAIDILAYTYFEWYGQEKKGLDWFLQLYENYKSAKKSNEVLAIVNSQGYLYSRLGDKQKAEQCFAESKHLMDSLGAYGYFQTYIASWKKKVDMLTQHELIQLYDKHFNNKLYLPAKRTAIEKAKIYSLSRQWDSLQIYLLQYKKLAGDSAVKNDVEYKALLATYYRRTNQYDKAIPLIKDLLKTAEEKGDLTDMRNKYGWLRNIYADMKDYKSAYEYFNRYDELKDSLNILNNDAEIASMDMQKEIEIQEVGFNEQKKLQEAEQEKTAFRNRIRFYSLLAGVVILLLVAGLLWRNNKQKQRAKTKIELAYSELKSTQAQLIQSEKMASLGELTAGIAHEIQNPLNFVNNFSDVNRELVDELQQELKAGKFEDAFSISNDIKENEVKINHHGKRADSIVKGMLQHSRANSGQKEPTDINALSGEYLRLAYHGLRAKDKSFNANFKTDFDNSIGKVNVIPQDMGRVILNLINNAFYTVDERKKKTGDGYEPTVSVSTKKNNGKVEIKVSDNGNGIPQKVLDKIFQPFFTTKPTGQGTGLGLSLTYDIVKAHNGEIKVNTKEGEGSEFVISLPVK